MLSPKVGNKVRMSSLTTLTQYSTGISTDRIEDRFKSRNKSICDSLHGKCKRVYK